MSDFVGDNKIELSDEFADIFASVFGENDVDCEPVQSDIPSSHSASDAIDDSLYSQNSGVSDIHDYKTFDEYDEYYGTDATAVSNYGTDDLTSNESDSEQEQNPDLEFDSRFKIGKRRHSKFSYGGHIVNEGADADYSQGIQPNYEELQSSYYSDEIASDEDYYEEEAAEEDSRVAKNRKFPFFKKKQKKDLSFSEDDLDSVQSYSVLDSDEQSEDSDYSPSSEEEYQYESQVSKYDYYDDDKKDISFKEYIASRLTALIFKIRGTVPEDEISATMIDEDEALGAELRVLDASNYYGSYIGSLKVRSEISVVLLVISIYISLGFPVPGMLQSLKVAVASVLAIQLTLLLLALDVATNAVLNAFRGKLGIDFLAVLSCILTSIDAVVVIKLNGTATHMPLCVISSLSLFGVLLSSLFSTRGIRKALRVPAIGKSAYTVTGEQSILPNGITLLKSTRPINGFLRRIEEMPIDEENFRRISPFILILSALFSLIVATVTSNFNNLLYIFTLLFSPAVPFTALLCFSLPFFIGSQRIFSSGAAIAGWSGTYDIGHSKNLIVTDRDLFPDECISIENVRIFADFDSSKVISYAGAIIRASQCGLTNAFENLLQENGCKPAELDSFECLSGGGFKSLIEGHEVYCGNIDVMRLMDIKTPYRLISKNSVLLSVDGVLYGIFNINYTPDPKVRKALVSLMRSNRHPVFAVRDFNITPDMIHDCFDIATDGYDFPPYIDRFPLSEAKPSDTSRISAVICREGLGPLTSMADTGRSIFVTAKINTAISIISGIFWLIFSLIKILASGQIAISTIIVYTLIFSVPVLILGTITSSAN